MKPTIKNIIAPFDPGLHLQFDRLWGIQRAASLLTQRWSWSMVLIAVFPLSGLSNLLKGYSAIPSDKRYVSVATGSGVRAVEGRPDLNSTLWILYIEGCFEAQGRMVQL